MLPGEGREIDALAKLPAEKQRSLAEAAETSEKIAIGAPSAHDPGDSKISNGTEKIGLAMQDFDRLATFKRRTLDSEAIWRHFAGHFRQPSHLEVRGAHPRLDGPERCVNCKRYQGLALTNFC